MLIWSVAAPERLGSAVRAAMDDPASRLFISVATAWEISIKTAVGRLRFPLDRLEAVLASMSVEPLPITLAHAIAAGRLPRHHGDPFDRMLVAQAQIERLTLVTDDPAIARYDVPTLGRGAA